MIKYGFQKALLVRGLSFVCDQSQASDQQGVKLYNPSNYSTLILTVETENSSLNRKSTIKPERNLQNLKNPDSKKNL